MLLLELSESLFVLFLGEADRVAVRVTNWLAGILAIEHVLVLVDELFELLLVNFDHFFVFTCFLSLLNELLVIFFIFTVVLLDSLFGIPFVFDIALHVQLVIMVIYFLLFFRRFVIKLWLKA